MIVQYVKEIAQLIFQKLSSFSNAYENYPNESNLKTFALISCLSLITLLVIIALRKSQPSIVPPPTPYQNTSYQKDD